MASPNVALVERYLEHLRKDRNRRPQTIYKYSLTCQALVRWCGPRPIVGLAVSDLRAFLDRERPAGRGPRAVGGLAPATRKREIMELRSLFKWMHEYEGLVARNEAVKLIAPTVHNELPHPAPEDAWVRLWGSDLSDSDRVAFGVAYFCGLRRSEVVSLCGWHVQDVPQLALGGFVRKGGSQGRAPLGKLLRLFVARRPELLGGSADSFLAALGRLRAERDPERLLLSWKDDRDMRFVSNQKYAQPEGLALPHLFNKRLALALVAAGLDRGLFSPHALRHSFCTNLLNMGVPLLDVSRLAGHSSVTVTQRYIQTSEDALDRLLGDDMGDMSALTVNPWV